MIECRKVGPCVRVVKAKPHQPACREQQSLTVGLACHRSCPVLRSVVRCAVLSRVMLCCASAWWTQLVTTVSWQTPELHAISPGTTAAVHAVRLATRLVSRSVRGTTWPTKTSPHESESESAPPTRNRMCVIGTRVEARASLPSSATARHAACRQSCMRPTWPANTRAACLDTRLMLPKRAGTGRPRMRPIDYCTAGLLWRRVHDITSSRPVGPPSN